MMKRPTSSAAGGEEWHTAAPPSTPASGSATKPLLRSRSGSKHRVHSIGAQQCRTVNPQQALTNTDDTPHPRKMYSGLPPVSPDSLSSQESVVPSRFPATTASFGRQGRTGPTSSTSAHVPSAPALSSAAPYVAASWNSASASLTPAAVPRHRVVTSGKRHAGGNSRWRRRHARQSEMRYVSLAGVVTLLVLTLLLLHRRPKADTSDAAFTEETIARHFSSSNASLQSRPDDADASRLEDFPARKEAKRRPPRDTAAAEDDEGEADRHAAAQRLRDGLRQIQLHRPLRSLGQQAPNERWREAEEFGALLGLLSPLSLDIPLLPWNPFRFPGPSTTPTERVSYLSPLFFSPHFREEEHSWATPRLAPPHEAEPERTADPAPADGATSSTRPAAAPHTLRAVLQQVEANTPPLFPSLWGRLPQDDVVAAAGGGALEEEAVKEGAAALEWLEKEDEAEEDDDGVVPQPFSEPKAEAWLTSRLPHRRLLTLLPWMSNLKEDLLVTSGPTHDRVHVFRMAFHREAADAAQRSGSAAMAASTMTSDSGFASTAPEKTTTMAGRRVALQEEELAEWWLHHPQEDEEAQDAPLNPEEERGAVPAKQRALAAAASSGKEKFSVRPVWSSPSISGAAAFMRQREQARAAERRHPNHPQEERGPHHRSFATTASNLVVGAIAADLMGDGHMDILLQNGLGHLFLIPHARDLASSRPSAGTSRVTEERDSEDEDDGVFPIVLTASSASAILDGHEAKKVPSLHFKDPLQPMLTAASLSSSSADNGKHVTNLLYVNEDGELLLLTFHSKGSETIQQRHTHTKGTPPDDSKEESSRRDDDPTFYSTAFDYWSSLRGAGPKVRDVFHYNVTSIVPGIVPGHREVLPYSVVQSDINADCAPELLYAVRDTDRQVLQIYAILTPPLQSAREASDATSGGTPVEPPKKADDVDASGHRSAYGAQYFLHSTADPWSAEWHHPTRDVAEGVKRTVGGGSGALLDAPRDAADPSFAAPVRHHLLLELEEREVSYGHLSLADVDGDGFVDLLLPYCRRLTETMNPSDTASEKERREEERGSPFDAPACETVDGIRVWYNIALGPTNTDASNKKTPKAEDHRRTTTRGSDAAEGDFGVRRREGPAAACLSARRHHLPHAEHFYNAVAARLSSSGSSEATTTTSSSRATPRTAQQAAMDFTDFGFRDEVSAAFPINVATCGLWSPSSTTETRSEEGGGAAGVPPRSAPDKSAAVTSCTRDHHGIKAMFRIEKDDDNDGSPPEAPNAAPAQRAASRRLRIPQLLRTGDFNRDGRDDVLLSSNVGPLVLTAATGDRVINVMPRHPAGAFRVPFTCAPLDPEMALRLLEFTHLEEETAYETYLRAERQQRRSSAPVRRTAPSWERPSEHRDEDGEQADVAPLGRGRMQSVKRWMKKKMARREPPPPPPTVLSKADPTTSGSLHYHSSPAGEEDLIAPSGRPAFASRLAERASRSLRYQVLLWYRDTTAFFLSSTQPGELRVGLTLLLRPTPEAEADPSSRKVPRRRFQRWLSLYQRTEYQHEHYYLLLSAVTPPSSERQTAATHRQDRSGPATLYGAPSLGVVHHLYWNDKDMAARETFVTQLPRLNGCALGSFQVLVGLGQTFSYVHRYMVGTRAIRLSALAASSCVPLRRHDPLAGRWPSVSGPVEWQCGGTPRDAGSSSSAAEWCAAAVSLHTREWPNFFVPNSQVFAMLHATTSSAGVLGDVAAGAREKEAGEPTPTPRRAEDERKWVEAEGALLRLFDVLQEAAGSDEGGHRDEEDVLRRVRHAVSRLSTAADAVGPQYPEDWSLSLYMPVQKYRRRLFIGLLVSLTLIGVPVVLLRWREIQQDELEWRNR